MRVTSLIVILAVVAAIAYVVIFQPPFIMNMLGKGSLAAQGYLPANSPQEAMDRFTKAIKARHYEAAALYMTRDCAEAYKKIHTGANSVAVLLDRVKNLLTEKGIHTNKALLALFYLDPFPTNFKVKEIRDDKGKKMGVFEAEPLMLQADMSNVGVDPLMFQHALAPWPFYFLLEPPHPPLMVELVEESDKTWKLKIDMAAAPQGRSNLLQKITYFETNWRTYNTALDDLVVQVRNGRIPTKEQAEREVLTALSNCKPK